MTPNQEAHLEALKHWLTDNLDQKYRQGQQEHGGNMWEKPGMLYCLWQEAWDFVSYVKTVSDQIQERDPDLYRFLMSPGPKDQ